ncbi:glycosyltransferase family 39 protein [Candidatus Saccharibacteria bacterium]|nr:glycosyltransferase family 39 protein [Candidatus Saccharibacteria bacterium]
MKPRTKVILLYSFLPLLFVAIYVALCLINIRGSIWFDESYSAYLVRGDFGQIWSETAQDVHPPLFYFLLKIWSGIFGTSDFAMRFMSVFFGALAIIMAFHLLKRWFGGKTATVATAFLALSPFLIRYGQEMRMYTLIFAIVIGATYALDLALETKKKRYYIIYAVLLALGMWTHYFTALAWLAHVVYLTAVKKINIFKKPFLWTYALAVLLFLPWIPAFLTQTATVQQGFWIPGVTFSTLPDYLSEVTIYREFSSHVDAWYALALIIWSALFGIVLYKTLKSPTKEKSLALETPKKITKLSLTKTLKKRNTSLLLLLVLVAVPPAILFVLSMPPLSSMFVSRYVTYSAILLWALVGVLVVKNFKNNKIFAMIFLVLSLGLEVVGIVNVETREPRGYSKEIVTLIRGLSEEGEPTVLKDGGLQEYDFSFYSTEENPIYIVDEWTDYPWGSTYPLRDYRATTIDKLEDLKADRFWVVASKDADPTEVLDLKKYEILTTVSNDHHLAIEYKVK